MSCVAHQFANAVRILMANGPIKRRLIQAYADHLERVDDGDLPAEVRMKSVGLRATLNRVAPIGKESRVRATVRKMSFAETAKYADAILELYVAIVRDSERADSGTEPDIRTARNRVGSDSSSRAEIGRA